MPTLLLLLLPFALQADDLQMVVNSYRVTIILLITFFMTIIVLMYLFIVRQRRLKHEIREQKEAFKTIFEKSHDGTLLLEEGKFIYCNEAIVKMLGYSSKEEVLNLHPSQLSPKYQSDGRLSFEKAEEMMEIALEQGYNRFEWIHTRSNGQPFWAEIVLTKINLHGKDIIHVVWRDIQERKEIEKQIKELNRQLEHKVSQRTMEQEILLSLFDKGESILFKWNNDATWSVEYVSKSIRHVLGYDPEAFESHRIVYAECIHKDDLEHVMQEVADAVTTQKEYFEHDPYRIYTRDGEIRWVHDATVIVRNKEEDITHFLGYITDITDLKEKEQQLLQQSKFAQMGEMMGMIAHQWRQPLNAIAATANNLSVKLAMESPQREYCQQEIAHISEYAQHLSITIDDFRSFFKQEKSKEEVSLRALCDETLRIVSGTLVRHQITLETDYRDNRPLSTLPGEMKQVLLNLIKNSEDALIEKGIKSPKIKIITENDDTQHSVIVSDNAGGIPEEIIDKIYEPYFSTKLEREGTGLGLYMSKKIIEEHCGGKLETKSSDEGATFTITLPSKEACR